MTTPTEGEIADFTVLNFRVGPMFFQIATDDENLSVTDSKAKYKGNPIAGNPFNLTFNLNRKAGKITLKGKNADLRGLVDPIPIHVSVGDYYAVNAALTNKLKPAITSFLRGYIDSLQLNKFTFNLKDGDSKDSLKLQGDISFEDDSIDLTGETMIVTWGDFTASVPAGSFTVKKDKYTAKKIPLGGPSTFDATFDLNFNKGTFKIDIKKADFNDQTSPVKFRLQVGSFDQVFWVQSQ